MTERILGPTGSARRRRWLVGPIALVAVLALFWVAGASAVHDDGNFELDKNATASGAVAGDDWSDVYASITADANDTGDDDKCIALGAVECAYAADPQGPDASIFTTGGSKDDLDIPNWRWTAGSVPDADEILDAYAAKYVNAADSHQELYFGADRFAVNGTKDFGFWFFQQPVGQNANGTFSGTHTGNPTLGGDDILILGTFTQGGATATVRVFRWVGTGGNATANGTVAGPAAAFGDCVPGSALDNGCATVNNATIDTGGWAYVAKASVGTNKIPSGGFVEGGIDLTALGLEGCFSSFVAETRSSASVDAQLKDFVLGNFEACGSGLTTTPANSAGTALTDSNANGLPDVSFGAGGSVDVKDSAALVINGVSTWSGTMHFFICGPIASGTCDGTTNVGTEVGSGTAVNQATTQPILSAAKTITAVGRYCWRGFFDSSTAGVPDATDSSATECFEVLQFQPALSTAQTWTVKDKATITVAGGGDLAGTAHFALYDNNTCTGTALYSQDVAVSGASPQNPETTPQTFTASAATLYWQVSYTSTNAAQADIPATCTENSSLTINN